MVTGFFRLQTPADLLAKLRHDLGRVEAAPTDEYCAFDFFVTAEHMLDWIYPGPSGEKTRKFLRQHPLLATCSNITNGAKHFQLLPHHIAVKDAVHVEGAFDRNAYSGESERSFRANVNTRSG
jgi:hypothetical protein